MTRDAIWRWGPPVLVLAGLFLPALTDNYNQYIINLILVYVVIGIGLNFLLGYAGQFAFAHAAMMGLGAYTTALLTNDFGWPFLLALPVSGLVATAVGSLGALPAMRMKRVYLALVTLAFAEFVQWTLIHWKDLPQGTDGVSVPSPDLFVVTLQTDRSVYYLLLVIVVIMYVVARRLVESRIGRSFVAIRENEIVAQCSGISIARTKALVFALSAFYAGIGGSMYAITIEYVVPDGFGLFQLVVHFSIVVIGGLISMFGSVIGAIVLTTLPEVLRDFKALQEIIYGIMLMAFIVLLPVGIAGGLKQVRLLPDEILARDWRRLRDRLPVPDSDPRAQAKGQEEGGPAPPAVGPEGGPR